MATYQITIKSSGTDMGLFTADSADAAYLAMVRGAGYDSAEAMVEAIGGTVEGHRADAHVVETHATKTYTQAQSAAS